jgi:hypothetical protein
MSNHVEQIKFTIESDTISAFKSRCRLEGVSMTSVIRQYMKTCQPAKGVQIKTDTRPFRRKAVSEIINLLDSIMQMEEQYRDNIPEQFQSRYESADLTCEQLSQAISCLEDAF